MSLELRLIGSSNLFYCVIGLFGLVCVSAFVTADTPSQIRVIISSPSQESAQRLIGMLHASHIHTITMRSDKDALDAIRRPDAAAWIRQNANGALTIYPSSISSREYVNNLVENAILPRLEKAARRVQREKILPEATLGIRRPPRSHINPTELTVTRRILCCIWLISAIFAIVSWLQMSNIYDRLIQRYPRWKIVAGKFLGCWIVSVPPLVVGAFATGVASSFDRNILIGQLATSVPAITLGVLQGIAIGAFPLAFGGKFREIAFAGVMGTNMMWLGLVMAAGAANPVSTMFRPARGALFWNPLYQICRLNDIASAYSALDPNTVYETCFRAGVLMVLLPILTLLLLQIRDGGLIAFWSHGD